MDAASVFEPGRLLESFGARQRRPEPSCAMVANTDPASVAEAFTQFAAPVWRILKRLGVAERSLEDATQDVFIVAHERWETFRGDSSRKTWLFGIATKVASKYRYRQRRPAEQPGLKGDASAQSSQVTDEPSPYERAASYQASERLQQLLDQLGDVERSLVVLVYLEELPVADAARSLGMRQYGAYKKLEKARQVLASGLRRSEMTGRARQPQTEKP